MDAPAVGCPSSGITGCDDRGEVAALVVGCRTGPLVLPTPPATSLRTLPQQIPFGSSLTWEAHRPRPAPGLIDWTYNGGANQFWTFQRVPGTIESNLFYIINQNSDECLTTDGIPGDQVFQEPCGSWSNAAQEWITGLRPNTIPLYYSIQSVYSGLYLDVYGNSSWPGAFIDTWYWNGGYNQYFGAG
jgi:Ricin-type beta-trefoil lectin domain-like